MRPIRRREQHQSSGKILPERIRWILRQAEQQGKSNAFTREIKEMFTEIINSHVKEESEKLSVFQQDGVYLATKKIGKNNPKEAEIRADNAARQEWNRTVDVALVEGVPEDDILTVKREKITDKTLTGDEVHTAGDFLIEETAFRDNRIFQRKSTEIFRGQN